MPAAPAPSERKRERAWVLPGVLAASLCGHGLLLAAAALLPEPAPAMASTHAEVAIDFVQPEAPPPPPEPEPEPEPEVERPAAVVDRPRPRVRRPEPPPEVEPSEEPPPPAEIMTAEGEGAADWDHPPGEEGGQLGGTPGGEGTGPVGPVAEGPAEVEAPRSGISRAELRRRLLDYMRSTLWGFVAGRVDHYPLAARRERLEGVVMLRIRLARDGRLLNVRLSRSSGHAMLDRAALASVEQLDSMPAPPDSIPWDDDRELPLPVTYQLDR
jgi:protein TonB